MQITICKAQHRAIFDTNTVIELNREAWSARNRDPEEVKKLAVQAISGANKLHYPRGLSYSYNILGHYYKIKGNYDSALNYYQKSFEIRQKLRDTLNIMRSQRNIMGMQKALGDYPKATITGLSAIKLAETKMKDSSVILEKAWLENNLGAIYYKSGEYKQAIYYTLQGKRLFEWQNNLEGLAASATSLGNIYDSQKLYKKAINEFETVIRLYLQSDNQRELAKAYNNLANVYESKEDYRQALSGYQKSLVIRQENGFEDDVKGSLQNIGIIYETLGMYDSAYYYGNEALRLSIASGDKEVECESHRALGTVLRKQKKYKEALKHLLTALSLCTEDAPERAEQLKQIAETYKAAGNKDSALLYTDQYVNLNDSLAEGLRRSIELESSLKEKDYELTISTEKNKKKDAIIIGMTLTICLLLIIFWLRYRSIRSKKNMLELKELVKDTELKALDAMFMGQEEERKRLAAELHDTIGSMLSATKYAFKAMERSLNNPPEENIVRYQKINTMLDETLDSVRRISHNMVSGVFTEQGITGALAILCETLEQTGKLKISLITHGFTQKLDYNTEVNLYRIVQELLTNIIKHSHAHNVTIQLIKSKENINLMVEDDGRGFDPEETNHKKGIGLSNIDLRVSRLSGKWHIDSGKGKGTTTVVDIPLNEELI